MPTIKDVAREAKVAVSTVSAVLNGTKYVSPGLHERVMETVRRLKYLPNDLARAMVAQQSYTLGLAFPTFSYVMLEALHGIRKVVDPSPYHLLMLSKEYTADELLALFQRRRIDGLLLFHRQWELSDCTRFMEAGMPFVVTSQYPGETPVPLVAADDLKGATQAVEYLCGLGHRKIGFIGGPKAAAASTLRYQGFVAALRQQGLVPEEMPVVFGVADDVEAESVAAAWLRQPPAEQPTALLTAHDFLAVGCYRAAHETGLRIPADISIMSFDHSVIAMGLQPALTAIEQSMEEKGARAARMLLAMVQDLSRPPRQILLPTRLTIRESCAAPPVQP